MKFESDTFRTIYMVAGGILGGSLASTDPFAGGLIPVFLGALIFFGLYFIIRETSGWFKALVLLVLVGVILMVPGLAERR